MRTVLLFASLAVACLGQDILAPPSVSKVIKMLGGDWRVANANVQFNGNAITHDTRTPVLVGRIQASPESKWRRFLTVVVDGNEVRADFSDARGRITHYRLREATDTILRFEDDPATGLPVHRLIYQKLPANTGVAYRFETGERVTDSGEMRPAALLRPLSE